MAAGDYQRCDFTSRGVSGCEGGRVAFPWVDIGVASGVVVSIVSLTLNIRKGKKDVESALVSDYDKLRIALCSEIDRLGKRVSSLEQENTALLKRLDRLETENDDLRRDRDEYLHELERRDMPIRDES
jgi:hypothetical protein